MIKTILNIIGWCEIAFGTTALAALIAAGIYFLWTAEAAKWIAILIVSIGFILGCIWATVIWRKHGTIEWLSSIRRVS